MAPLVSLLKEEGIIEAEALHQTETFGRAVQFARAEGIIPGPEPTHAIASAMMEAERAKEAGEEKVIVFNLSGHGHFDMAAYQDYLAGTLTDYEYPEEQVAAAMERVPVVAG
jgi:tryptophan synthase beta chain